MKTIVIGLGNPILTDDGIGVKVAYEVEAALNPEDNKDVTVTEASVGGLRLMELMIGYDRAIIIDALISQNGILPGTIKRMTFEDLRKISPTQHSASAHDTTLVTAYDLGIELGFKLPEKIVIFAVEVENVLEFSDQPTPAVAHSIPQVTAEVLKELVLGGNGYDFT